jgi:hypothetical protein
MNRAILYLCAAGIVLMLCLTAARAISGAIETAQHNREQQFTIE